MSILITGGAGFIGSNFVLDWLATTQETVINLDKLTYAGNLNNLKSLDNNRSHVFVKGDIGDQALLNSLFLRYQPKAVVHFAAESHVDRSIDEPNAFIQTNIMGTFQLLESAKAFWETLSEPDKEAFRFLHVSTDEVYGSLAVNAPAFTEHNQHQPNSPYSASKASSDHLVRAYFHTYGLPVLTTHCSNNYGPFQFPEKLMPLMIHNALEHKTLPVYGDGLQIRDWLYVGDHCSAIRAVLDHGRPGEVYNIGGLNEKTNIEVIHITCDILNELRPITADKTIGHYRDLITYIKDRPGHDRRYAIDTTKIEAELNWKPIESFESGLFKTITWYLEHPDWTQQIISGEYRQWIEKQYPQ